jgi:predicted 3-demethylubiquinone-9 3-methyltransferase (glyoxalase superfamily)
MTQKRLTTCLWFENQAEEAARYYTSIFPNSRILDTTRYGSAGPGPEGSVMTVNFEINGQEFVGLNGGPEFTFDEAISFQIHCANQAEVDRYWDTLTEGGQEGPCGWVKDKFGLSWQIVPDRLMELLQDPDPGRSQRAMACMLGQKKIDIAAVEQAAAGG